MKILFIFLLSIIIAVSANAQGIEGKLRYGAVVDFSKWDAELKDPNVTMERKKQLESFKVSIKKMEEQSYILTFNKYESIYKIEEKLGLEEASVRPSSVREHYKSLKDNQYINVYDMVGTLYFVSDTLQAFDWKLHDKTKTIGQYTCYKATYTQETESRELATTPDGRMEQKITIDTAIITAWYCPQIPIMNGPDKFTGLPGLILELTKTASLANLPLTLHCTEIILNPKGGVKIEKPEGKKLYTPMEFQSEMLKLQGLR